MDNSLPLSQLFSYASRAVIDGATSSEVDVTQFTARQVRDFDDAGLIVQSWTYPRPVWHWTVKALRLVEEFGESLLPSQRG